MSPSGSSWLTFDGFDARVGRADLRERHEALDVIGLPFEDGFDGSLGGVARPAGDPFALGEPAQRVAEEDSLNPSVDDDPPPHGP